MCEATALIVIWVSDKETIHAEQCSEMTSRSAACVSDGLSRISVPSSSILPEETTSLATPRANRVLEKGAYPYSRRPERFIHANENSSHV